jgi:hypothetical protein
VILLGQSSLNQKYKKQKRQNKMSFNYARWSSSPVTSYYIDEGAHMRSHAWRGIFAFFLTAAAMLGIYMLIDLRQVRADVPQMTPNQAAPAVAAVPAGRKVNELQIAVDQWLNLHPKSKWGISVRSIDGSNISAGHDSHQKITLASVYKLFLLQPLMISEPTSNWQTAAINNRSYADCVDVMLRLSDNPCAEAIGDKVGWSKSEKYLRASGYIHTTFMDKGKASGTAAETSQLLQNLYEGHGFNQTVRDLALKSMSAPKKKEAIRLACTDCKVYNKTGDLGTVHNDAAIVEKNGKTYVIVILSDRSNWQEVAELSAVIMKHL